MLHTYRKNDAVMVICQNNEAAQVEIAALNARAEELVGYSAEALTGKPLTAYLSDALAELVNEELAFNDPGYDLGDVLSKTYFLSFRHADGSMREFRLRLVRSESLGRNPVFHFVLQEEEIYREHEAFKRVLSENFKGHEVIDEVTGLPDRNSLLKDLELVQYYSQKKDFTACFAVIELDGYEALLSNKGLDYCQQAIANIGQMCRQKLRKEDAVGLMSHRALGMILMQITPESARIVLNRLRWSIHSMPLIMNDGQKLEATVSISFGMIGTQEPEKTMYRCERELLEQHGKGVNLLHEVAGIG